MPRFWTEAVVVSELPEEHLRDDPHRLVAPAPEGFVIFTLEPGAKPGEEEIEAAVEEVITDLENAGE